MKKCWGEMEKKRSYTFGPREVSQDFWKTRSVVGTRRFRSPVEVTLPMIYIPLHDVALIY